MKKLKKREREVLRLAVQSLYLYGEQARGPRGCLYDIIKTVSPKAARHIARMGPDEFWRRHFSEDD